MSLKKISKGVGGGVLGIITVGALIFGGLALTGFLLMLALGIVGNVFDVPKLAIGYWPSVGITFAVSIVRSVLFPSRTA